MDATLAPPTTVLDETQRAWLRQMAGALKIRLTDGPVQPEASEDGNAISSGAGDGESRGVHSLAGFTNVAPKPGSPQPVPLSQRKAPPPPGGPLQETPQAQNPTSPPKPKERFVVPVPREEKFAISNARTLAEVTKLVESGGAPTSAVLGDYHRVVNEAVNSPYVSSETSRLGRLLDGKVPNAAETEQRRESYAKLNEAVKAGKVEVAARISRELHLPIRFEEIQLHIQEEQTAALPHALATISGRR
jgi:hypothetical protein